MERDKAIRIIESSLDAMDWGAQMREAWETIRAELAVGQKPSTNSDLMQLLREGKDFMSLRNGSDEESRKFTRVIGRINAVLAQQH